MRHRFDPVRDLFTLQDRMNRLFEEAARRGGEAETEGEIERADWIPAADVSEEAGEFVITLDLPGIRRDGLDVNLDEGRLTIRGERPAQEGAQLRRSERPHGRCARTFSLPDVIDRHAITAEYPAGVLTLRLPKRAEPKERRLKIDIK